MIIGLVIVQFTPTMMVSIISSLSCSHTQYIFIYRIVTYFIKCKFILTIPLRETDHMAVNVEQPKTLPSTVIFQCPNSRDAKYMDIKAAGY